MASRVAPVAIPLAIVEAIGQITTATYFRIRKFIVGALASVGEMLRTCFEVFALFPRALKAPALIIKQAMELCVASIPLIFVTSIFIGMISAVSAKYQFRDMVPLKYLGTSVTKLTLLELGPVLIGLVMSGRIGSSIAAQIASMKEKEEVDAYTVLGLDPLRFLAAPRILVTMITMPILVIIGCFLAVVGAWAVSVSGMGVTSYTFLSGTRLFFSNYDIFVCLVKSVVFGLLISLLGYYHGMHSAGGAKGVGEATMKSVVSSSVMILMFDFLIAFLLLF